MYNHVFQSIQTPETAYWFGFIAGDGNICQEKNCKRFTLGLKQSDTQHIINLALFLGYSHKKVRTYSAKSYSCFRVNHPDIFDDLVNLGLMPRKSHKLTGDIIPDVFFYDFLRGLIDADGSLVLCKVGDRKKKKAVIALYGNYPLLASIQQIVNLGGCLSKHKNKDGRADSLLWGGIEDVKILLDRLYDNATIYLQRKYEKYLEIIEYVSTYKLQKKYTLYRDGRSCVIKTCQACGKGFLARSDKTTQYCSRDCANYTWGKQRRIYDFIHNGHGYMKKECLHCHAEIIFRTDSTRIKNNMTEFCNKQCKQAYQEYAC